MIFKFNSSLSLLNKSLIAAVSSVFLFACTNQQGPVSDVTGPTKTQAAEQLSTADPNNSDLQASVSKVPEKPLDAETMALLLDAEISAYRGDIDRSVKIYAEQAQRHADPGVAKRYAELALAAEDIQALLDASLLWYELAPEDTGAQQLAVRALARMSETEGAWQVVQRHPENHFAVRMLAAETRQSDYKPQVGWLFEQIVDAYGNQPESTEILIALSLLSEGIELIETAALYAESAANLSPEAILPTQLRANALLQLGKNDQAIAVLSEYAISESAPQDARIQIAQSLATISAEGALPAFLALSEEFPWDGNVLMGTAQILIGLGHFDEASKYYVQLSRIGEYRDLAHFNLGRIQEQKKNTDQAREYYLRVGQGDLEFEAKLRAALILTQKNPAKSNAEYDELLAAFPDKALTIYHEQGRVLAAEGATEDAIQVLTTALDKFEDNESLLYARSIAYESSNKIDSAVNDLRTILAQDNDNVSALNALGYTLANRTEQFDEAFTLIERALAMQPDDPAIIDSMGWVLYRLGRHSEALPYLERALDQFFDEEVISHLVEVLVALNRIDDAKGILDQSIQRLPDSDVIQLWLERLDAPES